MFKFMMIEKKLPNRNSISSKISLTKKKNELKVFLPSVKKKTEFIMS